MANLALDIPQPSVVAAKPFSGAVTVTGARPRAIVHVSLRQVGGTGTWSGGATVTADPTGDAVAGFPGVVLMGVPGTTEVATLVADATDDAGDWFWSDAKSTQVVG
jgi:hypothetical protein